MMQRYRKTDYVLKYESRDPIGTLSWNNAEVA